MNRSEAGKLGWQKSKDKHIEINKQRINDYYNSPSRCLNCNSILDYKKRSNKFCSHSCSAKKHNSTRQHKKCKSCDNLPKRGCRYCEDCFIKNKNEKIIKPLYLRKSSSSVRRYL